MIIYIKNMICQRCILVVKAILENLGIEATEIKMGFIMLKEKVSYFKLQHLDAALKETGLELIVDKNNLLVQKIKNIIFDIIHYSEDPLLMKFSCYLSQCLNYNYTYLSNLFKKLNGITIERYIILQKIEKVKTMLVSEGASLSEIASLLNYSSVSHLSAQFKKETGYTARDFKLLSIGSFTAGMQNKIAV